MIIIQGHHKMNEGVLRTQNEKHNAYSISDRIVKITQA